MNKDKLHSSMSIHSMSRWLRLTITTCYELSSPHELEKLFRITPHEIRAVSTSLTVLKHVPIKEVIKKGFWKTETSFINFYLKDLSQYDHSVGLETVSAGFSLQL